METTKTNGGGYGYTIGDQTFTHGSKKDSMTTTKKTAAAIVGSTQGTSLHRKRKARGGCTCGTVEGNKRCPVVGHLPADTDLAAVLAGLIAQRADLAARAERHARKNDSKRTLPQATRYATALARLDERINAFPCAVCHRTADERPGNRRLRDGVCGACREANAEAEADAADVKATRTRNAAEFVQTFPVAVLTAAARGDIDLNAIARAELGSRGLNRAGVWVGFPEAKRIAEQLPTTTADGRIVFVTIPTNEDK
jgi:hypothetical protein